AEVVAADADVAEAGVALLVAARAAVGAVVGDEGEVDVGLLGPQLGGLEDLVLPGRGGAEASVEGGEEVTGDAAEVGAVGLEADGDALGMRPDVGSRGVGHAALFEHFQAGARPQGAVAGSRAGREGEPG